VSPPALLSFSCHAGVISGMRTLSLLSIYFSCPCILFLISITNPLARSLLPDYLFLFPLFRARENLSPLCKPIPFPLPDCFSPWIVYINVFLKAQFIKTAAAKGVLIPKYPLYHLCAYLRLFTAFHSNLKIQRQVSMPRY